MQTASESNEKRVAADRRRRKIPPIKYLLFGGRRTGARRLRDKQGLVLVDKYDFKIMIIILSIIGLSVTDGVLTLFLAGHGANELNPLMKYFLNLDPLIFMGVKFVFTCSGLFLMLILSHTHFRPLKVRVRSLFPAILFVFLIVIGWQIYLRLYHIG